MARNAHVFLLVLERLRVPEDYEEVRRLDASHTVRALRWLAHFHGAHWASSVHTPRTGGNGVGLPIPGVLRHGGWWRAAVRPGLDYAALPRVFDEHLALMADAYSANGMGSDAASHADNRVLIGELAVRAEALHAGYSFATYITPSHHLL